jgi:hypothetical protein
MGNEGSHQFPSGDHQDSSGNIVNCAMQHLKLADWEKSGIRLHEPNPVNKTQVYNANT